MAKKAIKTKKSVTKKVTAQFNPKHAAVADKKQKGLEKPVYFAETIIKCACGAEHKVGSTRKDIKVEICSACHPFFTGSQKFIDTAGQVDKFKARMKKFEDLKSKKVVKKTAEVRDKKVVAKKSTFKKINDKSN